jgi:hypothetical protein
MRFFSLCVLVFAASAVVATASDPKAEAREALWAAVRAGDEKAIVAVLEKGADVNAKNEYGISALWIAANKGKKEVIELLLARGADPNARDGIWYQTPLSHSLMNLDNVKLLLKAGAKDVDPAAIAVAGRNNLPILQAILDTGKVSRAALDAALFSAPEANKEVREALTKAGAKPVPAAAEKDREAWKVYAGSYESEYGGTLKFEVQEAGLVTATAFSRTLYKPTGKDTFAPLGSDSNSLTFEMKDGKVARVLSRRFTAEAVYFPAGSKPVAKVAAPPKDIGGGKAVAPANWPQFRGVDSTGVADGQDPPLTFDVKEGTNIRWKTPIPGLGHSSPVIWGDRV